MITKTLTLPELGFIIATRAALGAGVALLLGQKLNMSTRRAVGLALAGVGVVTTIPAAMVLFRSDRRRIASSFGQDRQLIGSTRFPRKGDEEY
jgi:hypothetical protein